jgi:hypothetical protein
VPAVVDHEYVVPATPVAPAWRFTVPPGQAGPSLLAFAVGCGSIVTVKDVVAVHPLALATVKMPVYVAAGASDGMLYTIEPIDGSGKLADVTSEKLAATAPSSPSHEILYVEGLFVAV